MRFVPGYRRFALPAFVGAAVAAVVLPPLGAVLLTVGAFALQFLRDLECSLPDEPGVVAPADGCVPVIHVEDGHVHVGMFTNVTDVHVNRVPVSGSIRTVTHRPGACKPAFSKDSDCSEYVDIKFDTDAGDREVSLIVGAFARWVHLHVVPGDELVRDQKLGYIDFGSRADVLLPPESGSEDVVVEKGESVRAGETALTRWE